MASVVVIVVVVVAIGFLWPDSCWVQGFRKHEVGGSPYIYERASLVPRPSSPPSPPIYAEKERGRPGNRGLASFPGHSLPSPVIIWRGREENLGTRLQEGVFRCQSIKCHNCYCSASCSGLVVEASKRIGNINIYNIYEPCINTLLHHAISKMRLISANDDEEWDIIIIL